MDRDVYLILVGAGISLASSFVTLLLQFIFGLIGDRIRDTKRQRYELRQMLLDKTPPRPYNQTIQKMVGSIDNEIGIEEMINDISRFAYRPSYQLPLVNFLVMFVTVFLIWIFIVLPNIH